MPVEPLSPQDSTLWNVQAPEAPLQIGGLAFFESGPLHDAAGKLRLDDLRRHTEVRLGNAPRLRRRLVTLPLDQGVVWVDDDRFDIEHHVRRDALRRPVTDARLREHVRELLATPLDPTRPLWEMRVVDGVEGDRVALILKVSHVVVDGMGLLGFAASLLDLEPTLHGDEAPSWEPAPSPGPLSLLAANAVPLARQHLGSMWTLARGLTDPRLLAGAAGALVRVGAGPGGVMPPLPVTGSVGTHRDFAWIRLDLNELLRAKRSQGVTLNDVVLAIVGGGLAHYLERRGTPIGDRPSKILVPVSTHGADAAREIENRFSIMLAAVPLNAADPLDRLRAVHAEMEQHKQTSQDAMGPLLFAVGDLVPNWLLRATGPSVLRHQPFANLTVTNLPGSRDPLYLLGARLLELFPFITVIGNIALIVGVISYENGLGVSFTVDADVIGDVDVLAECVELAARELVAAAGT